ncbi:replicative DNA helicase [Flagellimonas sp.]|uniref:replicative DNA helicase n=1 Tax=Flagellimonas sp. TaxID=2058762 RepID=UPI003F4A3B16
MSKTDHIKKLPTAIDIEQAVLSVMFNDTTAPDILFSIVRSEKAFYEFRSQLIYMAMFELYSKSEPIDLLTVSEKLRQMEKLELAGGDFHLITLSQKVTSSAHTEYHCRILLQKYLKRCVIQMNSQIIGLAYDDATDVFDLLDGYQKQFDRIVDITQSGRRTVTFPESLGNLKTEIERLSNNDEEVPLVGRTTGFKSTDAHTGGYRPGQLVILAARPGMGKTSKALKTVVGNLKRKVPVGFISLEMSMAELTARIVAIDTDFHLKQLLKTGFEKLDYFTTYDAHCKRMNVYPLHVNDSGVGDLTEIIVQAKAWKRSENIQLLVVDYLQLMGDKTIGNGNRESEISSISRRLKLLAKELEIPIIALSQLSRAVETRGGDKRPRLSDLRDSGAIEQDADIVEFIYRPSYYHKDSTLNREDYEKKNQRRFDLGANVEIIYAKFRGGSPATILMRWVGNKTKFLCVDDDSDTAEYIDAQLPTGITAEEAFGDDKTVFDAE